MSEVGPNDLPEWKSWYRWPFLALALFGAGMAILGVQQCIALWSALRDGAPDIEVNTAMSAFPPLGVGFIAIGSMAFLPRTADGTAIRPIVDGRGKRHDPAMIALIVTLAGFLLYPVCGVVLHVATTEILTKRGYTATTARVSGASGYLTTHWHRV